MNIVLIIDDDPISLKLIEAQLHELRYRLMTASSGRTGLDTARSLNPDLILLDIKMPDMNGFEVLKKMREDDITKDIPVIMLTSVSDKEVVLNAMHQGVIDYIVKPYNVEHLKEKVKAGIKYSAIKKEALIISKDELVVTSWDADSVLVTFRYHLKDKYLLEEIKKLFNPFFIRKIQDRVCVIDLRPIAELNGSDVKVLETVIKLLKGKKVVVVAGRHYGTIVANSNLEDSVKLFVSYGDMTIFMHSDGYRNVPIS